MTISEPHRRVISGMVVEGIGLKTHVPLPFVQGMEEAWDEIGVTVIQGWIGHSMRFFL